MAGKSRSPSCSRTARKRGEKPEVRRKSSPKVDFPGRIRARGSRDVALATWNDGWRAWLPSSYAFTRHTLRDSSPFANARGCGAERQGFPHAMQKHGHEALFGHRAALERRKARRL